ncbi:MAG: hypothetical protein PHI40_00590 [Caldisericia bacterium]|nr:hypothetical protein [Caldisericia bacterium]MDD4613896.1 hypothetical protein [Caldisericia bacterium]
MRKSRLIFVGGVVLSILLLTIPSKTSAKQDWMKGTLGKYLEKLNDQYLTSRMSTEALEKNAEWFLRDYLTMEDLSHLEHPNVAELITFPSLYDEKEILFHGEAIGQIMRRGEYCWLNVKDTDGNSLGCWMPVHFSEGIVHLGKYRIQGDLLLLKGIFHSAREDHGGETELEVNDIVLLEKGKRIPPEEVSYPFVYSIFILVLGILAFMVYQHHFEKKKQHSSGGGMFFGDQN